jgi:hypothetical protein
VSDNSSSETKDLKRKLRKEMKQQFINVDSKVDKLGAQFRDFSGKLIVLQDK